MQPKNTDQDGRQHDAAPKSLAERFNSLWRKKVGSKSFENWLSKSIRVTIHDRQCTIAVSNEFLQRTVQRTYAAAARAALAEVLGEHAELLFMIDPSIEPEKTKAKSTAAPEKRTSESKAVARPAPVVGQTRRTGRRMLELRDFVEGEANAFALAAARRLCAAPLDGPSLTCFFSRVGLGKTHLLQGTHQQIRRDHPELKTVFLTAEMFSNQFSESLSRRGTAGFRSQFRSLDVLLVDDVEFFESKRVFQEEFLHTIDSIEEHGGKVVVTADRSPHLLTQLSEDLRNRFLAGVMCRIQPLDLPSRVTLLRAKAIRLGCEMTDDAVTLVAEKLHKNVRELEGVLHTLHTHSLTTGKRITVTQARKVISDLERDCLRCVRISDVEHAVCETFGIKGRDLKSPSRSRSVSQPRMVAMYLARKHTKAAYNEIGKHFKRNHSTVVSAERKVDGWLSDNSEVQVASQAWLIQDLIESLEHRLQVG